ncbi:MAG: helix-turn-helix domain-containing protein [Phycisphaerae bacterium]|jgi:biotin operon repressor
MEDQIERLIEDVEAELPRGIYHYRGSRFLDTGSRWTDDDEQGTQAFDEAKGKLAEHIREVAAATANDHGELSAKLFAFADAIADVGEESAAKLWPSIKPALQALAAHPDTTKGEPLTPDQRELIDVLRDRPDGMQSPELARNLGISEEAVRGRIARLRGKGFRIQNTPNVGYRLT